MWRTCGPAASGSAAPPAYPALALGVFETTPMRVAAAFAVLANGGVRVPLGAITRVSGGNGTIDLTTDTTHRVAAADSVFVVTQMLRSVLDGGTATAARRRGFLHTAAGKTGTTDGLRDAWFAGFAPSLVTVVWLGMDDGSSLGLTGAEAALPIWTDFMSRALPGRTPSEFSPPPGTTVVEVDTVTGLRSTPRCPATLQESFRHGTEPRETCPLH